MLLTMVVSTGHAQSSGPFLVVYGDPDTTSSPPNVRTYLSVIDRSDARSIEGLTTNSFSLRESGADVQTDNVSYESVGLAIAVVVDRGGISAPGDGRIKEATDLVRELLNRLSVAGAGSDDVIAIVGVGADGLLEPKEDFTYNPVDTNLVQNALVVMEGEAVRGGTPLYEGLDEALRLLTENTDAAIRGVLSYRRKAVVVFSDGIDPNFSDEAREGDIIRKAEANGISIYTIGMAQRNRALSAERNLVRLANQTSGLYQLHNSDETHQQVLTLLDNLITQRSQYLIIHRTGLPKGEYTLNIAVGTPVGSAETRTSFSSVLEAPRLALIAPTDGLSITTPYSRTLKEFITTTVQLRVEITSRDGAPRDPAEVRYLANGELIGASSAAPNFDFTWNVSGLKTPLEDPQNQRFTLTAEANDAYLGTEMKSAPVTIQVNWEAKEVPVVEKVAEEGMRNWWVILVLTGLLLGLLVLFILLLRTRGEMARRVVQSTTGVLRGVTRRLSDVPQRAPAKLVIVQGANVGKEFRLAAPLIKVGRDPQFCDFALYDEYSSNPHFSIQMDQTQFYITDEGSTNGTRLNGMPLQPHQRVLLQPDAVIEAGQTRMQFKRLGGTTRHLGARDSGGAGLRSAPPTQPAADGMRDGPPDPTQRGGPTRRVPPEL
jgi:Mg-chelatase subunit ChlD